MCKRVIAAYGAKTLLECLHCVQLASQHMPESEILVLPDGNIHISSGLKTFSTGSNTEALWKKGKNKCQESFCRCLQQNVPGYDAIVRLCRDVSSFCQLFQQGASSASSIYVSTAAGTWPAGLMMSRGDRWFLLSSGVMAPSLVSVIEPRLTDTPTGWQTFT